MLIVELMNPELCMDHGHRAPKGRLPMFLASLFWHDACYEHVGKMGQSCVNFERQALTGCISEAHSNPLQHLGKADSSIWRITLCSKKL